jgi:hypothetical protein
MQLQLKDGQQLTTNNGLEQLGLQEASPFYNTQGQWFQTIGTKIQKVSNKIHQKTLRGGANFLVCSPSVATILESIPGYAADTNGDKMDFAMGVQKVGQLNSRFRVYKNPYMTENIILMGYRGSQFLETGAVYAPYIPLMMTPLVYDPTTFTPRKGIMTRYAKKMIRPEFYGKIFVQTFSNCIIYHMNKKLKRASALFFFIKKFVYLYVNDNVIYMASNHHTDQVFKEKRRPKNPIKFQLQLNDEQKQAKALIVENPVVVLREWLVQEKL